MARRRWTLAAVLAVAVTVAGLGVASPWWVKSPQQLAAETSPPSPSMLTAPVERRVVSQTVVLRGEVTSPQVFDVTPSSGPDGAPPVVTAVRVRPGDEIAAGDVVLEVSGRPLIALPGEVPAYRDLRPGTEGEDIAQLQRALQQLGYGQAEADGKFGPATTQAVAAFYQDRGYQPPTTGDEEAVEAAEVEVRQLERQVEDAREAWDGAATPEERREVSKELERAEEDLDRARARLARLRDRTGPMVPRSELVFLPSFPARVLALTARVGSQVEAPLVSLASGPLVVRAQASAAQRELLRPDLPVEIFPESGDPTTGTVTSIDEVGPEPGDAVTSGHTVTTTPDTPLDGALAGRGARVTIEAASSGDEVLAVPISGLYAAADGSVYVITRTPAGEQRIVTVVPEVSGDGYVAVRPVDGDLSPGDLVVVGSPAPPPPAPDGR